MITLAQAVVSKTTWDFTGNNDTIVYGSATTANNRLVLCVIAAPNRTPVSVTGDAGGAWTLSGSIRNATTGNEFTLYLYTHRTASAVTTVTIEHDSDGIFAGGGALFELTDVPASPTIQQTFTEVTGSATSHVAGAISVATANAFLVGGTGDGQVEALTLDAAFTSVNSGSTPAAWVLGYRIVSSASSYNITNTTVNPVTSGTFLTAIEGNAPAGGSSIVPLVDFYRRLRS